jgi:hypothetical protein
VIIGLCGAAGSGKNAVAGFLGDTFGFQQAALADPLYEAVAAITGMSIDELQDRRHKEQVIGWIGRSPRQLLQSLGTEWGRDMVSRTLWIDHLFRRLDGLQAAGISVVVTDVRFDNEAQLLRDRYDARVWRVVRPAGTVSGEAMQHSSESGIAAGLVDRVVKNVGTLAKLREAVTAAAAADISMSALQKATIRE